MGTFTRLGRGGARSEMRREYVRRSVSSISSRQRNRVDVDIFLVRGLTVIGGSENGARGKVLKQNVPVYL